MGDAMNMPAMESTDSINPPSDHLADEEKIEADDEEIEGLDSDSGCWSDYPIDALLIRHETRTIHDVLRRIEKGYYVMNPDFQRAFVWDKKKQSKLIESVIMRIPLPVFYVAEDKDGKIIVVDGLQRLYTFKHFVNNKFKLDLKGRLELHDKKFKDLESKLQNRVEDCNLIFYILDAKAPERACLDIFERVNNGEPLTRQQMRNSLCMGPGTKFLEENSKTEIFQRATGKSLNSKKMRDREFVNRFCAFQLFNINIYSGDMDHFLAKSLHKMNKMKKLELSKLSKEFENSLQNNLIIFGEHAFRKHQLGQKKRNPLNISLWDVMSTGLSRYETERVQERKEPLRDAIFKLLNDEMFNTAITHTTNHTKKVKNRFQLAQKVFLEILDAHTN